MREAIYVELDPIEVIYVRKTGSYHDAPAKAWETLMFFLREEALFSHVKSRYAIAHDNPLITKEEHLRYDACILLDKKISLKGEVLSKTLAGGKYARFLHEGAYERLDQSYQEISDWIVAHNVRLRNEPIFQKYLDLDPRGVESEKLKTEIYVPMNN